MWTFVSFSECECVCGSHILMVKYEVSEFMSLSLGSSRELLCSACPFSAYTEPLIEALQAAKKVEPYRVWRPVSCPSLQSDTIAP